MNAPLWNIRVAAVKKLTDQSLLALIAKHAADADMHKAATSLVKRGNIDDIDTSPGIAKSITDSWREVRLAAMDNLTDQTHLAEVAVIDDKFEEHIGIRMAAVKKLTDQSVLTDLANNNSESSMHEAAKKRLAELSIPSQQSS